MVTDGDRLAVLEGLVRHIIKELHDQNEALEHARLRDVAAYTVLEKLDRLADEAAPLLESPVAKWAAQRRALKAARGGNKQVVDG